MVYLVAAIKPTLVVGWLWGVNALFAFGYEKNQITKRY
jgi:hypothetical protein